jgi:Mrp family chromosome partitioning ATPase
MKKKTPVCCPASCKKILLSLSLGLSIGILVFGGLLATVCNKKVVATCSLLVTSLDGLESVQDRLETFRQLSVSSDTLFYAADLLKEKNISADTIFNMLQVTSSENSDIITIQVTSKDSDTAVEICSAVCSGAQNTFLTLGVGSAELVDQKWSMTGLGYSVAFGYAAFAFLLTFFSVLGILLLKDYQNRRFASAYVCRLQKDTDLRLAFLESQANVEAAIGHYPFVIALVSPIKKSGVTTASANLAILFSESGVKTLLIDGNLRNPSLYKAFSCKNQKGLSDYFLSDQYDIQTTAFSDLSFLAAGDYFDTSPENFFLGKKFYDLLLALRNTYDLILIDSPAYEYPEAALICGKCDLVVPVVHRKCCSYSLLKSMLQKMKWQNIQTSGWILNDAPQYKDKQK